jgi:hypothetical protein
MAHGRAARGGCRLLLVPVLNALTTGKHLGATIAHGDWALAGVDLTLLVFGVLFGIIAWVSRRKWTSERAAKAVSPPVVSEVAT